MISSIHFLPHGMQIIPGLEQSYDDRFSSLDKAMREVKLQGEIVLLITPHGLSLEDEYLFYKHDLYQGLYYNIEPKTSVIYGEIISKKLFAGNQEITSLFMKEMDEIISVRSAIQGGSDYAMTLAWGETVPLYYLQENIEVIIMSIPRKRYSDLTAMKGELKSIGSKINEISNNVVFKDRKINVVISGDLAHAHSIDGAYGFHESAKIFDEMVIQWSETREEKHLNELLELNKTALACGMAGICILQGLFNKIEVEQTLKHYSCPTYFGMMVSSWKPINY